MIFNKSKNTKCSESLSSTNPNITKQILQHTNTEIFNFLWGKGGGKGCLRDNKGF